MPIRRVHLIREVIDFRISQFGWNAYHSETHWHFFCERKNKMKRLKHFCSLLLNILRLFISCNKKYINQNRNSFQRRDQFDLISHGIQSVTFPHVPILFLVPVFQYAGHPAYNVNSKDALCWASLWIDIFQCRSLCRCIYKTIQVWM